MQAASWARGRVMARRKDSSETIIAITILTVNLIRWEQEVTRILFFVFPAICEIDNFDGNNEVYRMAGIAASGSAALI